MLEKSRVLRKDVKGYCRVDKQYAKIFTIF